MDEGNGKVPGPIAAYALSIPHSEYIRNTILFIMTLCTTLGREP